MNGETIKTLSNPKAAAKTAVSLMSGKNSRIGNGIAVLLVLSALVADLLTLIPIVGDFVGPLFWAAIAVYLWRKGCGFINARRLATEAISTVAEMIPAVQELPTILLGMILVIVFIRFEDRTGISVVKPMSNGRRPLNMNGMRLPQANEIEPSASRNQNLQPLNMDGIRQPS